MKSADALVDAVQSAVGELYASTRSEAPAGELAATENKGISGTPFVVAGGVLAAAGVVGMIWSLSVHAKIGSDMGSVSSGQAKAASAIWPASIAAAGVGAGLVGFGVYRLLHAPGEVAVAPMPHGAVVALGGHF